jgi:hypothetical protein
MLSWLTYVDNQRVENVKCLQLTADIKWDLGFKSYQKWHKVGEIIGISDSSIPVP